MPPEEQFTTSVALGELLHGVTKRGSPELAVRVRDLITGAAGVLPFDALAAEVFGPSRARLESEGRRLDEPDLRIASLALSR